MPSQKAPAKGGGRKDDGDEARTPLQAVVLADSFTQVRTFLTCRQSPLCRAISSAHLHNIAVSFIVNSLVMS